jgi:hypothetical protein
VAWNRSPWVLRLPAVVSRLEAEAQRLSDLAPATDAQSLGRYPSVSKALDRVLATWSPEIPIIASTIATEVSRRVSLCKLI